jgi:hypothetical protein
MDFAAVHDVAGVGDPTSEDGGAVPLGDILLELWGTRRTCCVPCRADGR